MAEKPTVLEYLPPRRARRRPMPFVALWALYAVAYSVVTPAFAVTEAVIGRSWNTVFVGVWALARLLIVRAGCDASTALIIVPPLLNAAAYGLLLACAHAFTRRKRTREADQVTKRTR